MRLFRWLLVSACCALSLAAADDPREIVRRALQIHAQNEEIARSYTYLRRVESRAVDSSGAVRQTNSKTWDVTMLEGSPFTRLVQRDDKPLPPKDEQQEQAKLKASIEQRSKETPEQRQQRIDAWDRRRKAQEQELKEVQDAFNFRLAGEEEIDGHPAWIIEGTPRPGFKSKSKAAGYFTKMKGRMWVTKGDYYPVKIEAETIDTISLGAFLVRFQKGAHFVVEQTRVNGEVWLPKHVSLIGSARIMLVKGVRINTDITQSNFKKFSAESRVVSTSAQ